MNFDKSVYVDTSALEAWKLKMNNINTAAISSLNDFVSTANRLNESWQGASSEGASNYKEDLITEALNKHEEMKNVENFLQEVIITMENQ